MKNSYMEKNYPNIPEKKNPSKLPLNLYAEVLTLVHFVLSFLSAPCKSWKCYKN